MTDRLTQAQAAAALVADTNQRAIAAEAWLNRYAPVFCTPEGHMCSFAIAALMEMRRQQPGMSGEPLLQAVTARRNARLERLGMPDLIVQDPR